MNSGGGAGLASVSNDMKMEMNFVKESVNKLVKDEISALQKSLLDAIKSQAAPVQPPAPVEVINITVQGKEIPVTWGPGVKIESVTKVLREYRPFKEWVDNISTPANMAHILVKGILIQSIDHFGPRIGFVKFITSVVNEAGQFIPGIVFMRGGSVGILVVLKLREEGDPDDGKEYTIITIQPRVPVGEARFAEIPAGMLDDGHFGGVAAKELREETGIDIKEEDLIDLSGLAYNGKYHGMYPSAGGCDEVLRLFLYRTNVSREQLDSYQNKLTGVAEEGENICLKVLPLEQLWIEAADAKALSALYLYHALSSRGIIARDY